MRGWTPLVLLLTWTVVLTPGIAAQDAPPPEDTTVVVERSLSEPGHASITPCPDDKNPGVFGEDGLTVTLNGSCWAGTNDSSQLVLFPGLGVQDGEIRFDLRVSHGHDQFGLIAVTRMLPVPPHTMMAPLRMPTVYFDMPRDQIGISIGDAEGPVRSGLRQAIPPDTWATITVRLQGPEIDVLINEQPFLLFAAPDSESGLAGRDFGITGVRLGRAEMTEDVVFTLRNLYVAERVTPGASPSPGIPDIRDLLGPAVPR